MLLETITNDLKNAMRSKEAEKLSALRMLLADLKNKKIALNKELTDQDIQLVVSSAIKKRKESIESYQKGGRVDLTKPEEAAIEVLKKYLPEQLSEEALAQIVKKAVQETGAASAKDFGKVMSKIMPQVKGKADGQLVSQLVKKELSS